MKLLSVVRKCLKEQRRNFWIMILTITMAPFFVGVYYFINEASKTYYDLLVLNQDKGISVLNKEMNYGNLLVETAKLFEEESKNIPLRIKVIEDRKESEERLKSKKSDALVIIPADFSKKINKMMSSGNNNYIEFEFVGDLTNVNYMISAVWANEILNEYVTQLTQRERPVIIKETSLGLSGKVDDFDLWMPGLLILALIMLMFSASIAMIVEVENKTIIRLKLSRISSLELLTGISSVQVIIGMISIFLTLVTAIYFGFDYIGSIWLLVLIAILTSISIIAFSLILAAVTKTANEILVVGNFPLFLKATQHKYFLKLMKGAEMFSIAGYSITLQGLMSPTHAIEALRKVLIMGMGLFDIIPEIIALIIITIVYFIIGVWAFNRRHMRIV